jgi:Uma2 family endonuclease
MTSVITIPIQYPSGDGQPVAETFDHLYVILITIAVLRQYLQPEKACILGNQFLYYAQGLPRLRCAPDVMVIFGVEPGGRDNYKIWEEGEIPRIVFEVTSPSTKKKEYWQFDPKGEWIPEKLRGYRLINDAYVPIENSQSQALNLRLAVDGKLIAFYRLDNGEKLLIPDELYEKSNQLQANSQQLQSELVAERSQKQVLQQELDRYRERFGEL